MSAVDVLVSVETGDGMAGVVRDRDGSLWLSSPLDRISGPRLDDFRPEHLGLPDDRTAIGGRMPAGAVGAEAVDDAGQRITAAVGGGAWIAVLDQPIRGQVPPSWCWNPDGEPVAAALPVDWPRRPIDDAEEPCPACGRTAWDEVRATDDSRGMSGTGTDSLEAPPVVDYTGMEPTPFAVCRACGYEEPIGSLHRYAAPSDPPSPEQEQRIRDELERRRAAERDMLAGIPFPVFADRGRPATLGGSGSSDGVLSRITVQQGGDVGEPGFTLRVETEMSDEFPRSEYAQALDELDHWLDNANDLPFERSDAGLIIAWRARDRERRRRAALAARDSAHIRVQGSPELFCLLRSGDRWAAVRRRAEQTLTLVAKQVDPAGLDLVPLDDPSRELA